jgi:PhnB protein
MKVSPYLNFGGNAEEAFDFYRAVFGGDFAAVMRFRDFGANPMNIPERELDRIAHIALPVGDRLLMASDVVEGWQPLKIGNNVYITLETDSAEEAERLFGALAQGGQIEMELQRTEWAEKYGTCGDRFGVQWMVMYAGDVQFGAS